MPPAPRSLRLGTIGLHKLSSPPIPHKHLEISAPTNCPSVPGHQHLELSALIKCEPQVSNTGNVDLEYWTLISNTGECRPRVLDSHHNTVECRPLVLESHHQHGNVDLMFWPLITISGECKPQVVVSHHLSFPKLTDKIRVEDPIPRLSHIDSYSTSIRSFLDISLLGGWHCKYYPGLLYWHRFPET